MKQRWLATNLDGQPPPTTVDELVIELDLIPATAQTACMPSEASLTPNKSSRRSPTSSLRERR
jgi:hypothetical protein